jgi:hypothetical protein
MPRQSSHSGGVITLNPLSPDVAARATPHIEASLKRSNPDGNTVADVLAAIETGDARLWLGPDSAVVTTLLQNAQISLDELVWHAGGSIRGVLDILAYGGAACAMAGCDRLVLFAGENETRKGWEKVLAPHGFRKVTLLVKDLQE